MYSLRVGTVAVLAISITIASLAFADDDKKGKGKGKGEDKKPELVLPISLLGTTSEALKQQIESLQQTLKKLKEERTGIIDDVASTTKAARNALKMEIKETKQEIKETKRELKFLRSLSRGMSGDDVRALQELLAQDREIFSPSLITGYFGALTEKALKLFQKKHKIQAVGIFGPKTQAKILSLFVGRELPPVIIKRLGLTESTTTPGVGLVTVCHKPPGNPSNMQTIVIGVPALGAHLAHGDTVGICPGGIGTTTPPSPPPPPDTTAPTISNITVSGVSSSSAMIGWMTDEAASSKVHYGTTTPVDFATALTISSAVATTTHSFTIVGLTASTTQYFALESKDAANNIATTSTQSFVTLQ